MHKAEIIARLLNLRPQQVENTIRLLDAGATVPFISRYRKEATGGLTDVEVDAVSRKNEWAENLIHRREFITEAIEAAGSLTDELKQRLADCWDEQVLEDIYLPFKPKRHTRAAKARARGLEPLADLLLHRPQCNPEAEARRFIHNDVADEAEALQGARDIIAERVNEDERVRATLRQTYKLTAKVCCKVVKGKEAEAAKYRDYFDWSEPLRRCTSHRMLAMRRGEAEGLLRLSILPGDETDALRRLSRFYLHHDGAAARQIEMALNDAYKRLLRPSIETEFAAQSKQQADNEAIQVFATNLRQLLLAPPLGPKHIMGIDPGFRTGCKVVCLDAQGNLLHHEAIFPHPPRNEYARAGFRLKQLVEDYGVEAIAIGAGTAGRETEELVQALHLQGVDTFLVSEDGASVYSASAIGREEFPDEDVTVRGAVSIGRRLADPLSELVKIDARSIGVGQYQHDVDQAALRRSLDTTVEACVNTVGVNLNTASKHLLTYVSGLGEALARSIVGYRTEHGPFRARKDLLNVPRLGAPASEQCAGFLRIPGADNPLDHTAVPPERYALVERMAEEAGCDVATLIASPERRQGIRLQAYCTDEIGMPTLTDIMNELDKPGRDPRGQAKVFSFDPRLHSLDDLDVGMEVPGVVTNITKFGCFVDMGIKVKGLVHVSQMANHYVKDPTALVHIQQQVMVRILDIDEERGRVSLKLLH